MRIIKERTALAAVSELRTHLDEILAQLKDSPVTLEKHNRPVAVLSDPSRFAAMERAIEDASDILLAFESKERLRKPRPGKNLTLEQVEKRFA